MNNKRKIFASILATLLLCALLTGALAEAVAVGRYNRVAWNDGRGRGGRNDYGRSNYGRNDYGRGGYDDWGRGGSRQQQARVIEKLSLRVKPSNKTAAVGTYKIVGRYVNVTRKCWDDVNHIWWVEVNFEYNERRITGWTGSKRLDKYSYDLDRVPEYYY